LRIVEHSLPCGPSQLSALALRFVNEDGGGEDNGIGDADGLNEQIRCLEQRS
jgi:hypothetical protein